MDQETPSRNQVWESTMQGHAEAGIVTTHDRGGSAILSSVVKDRQAREEAERETLATGATQARGAGHRARPEEPDPLRTCFERDRDRILHSAPFRRLAGKTQVFVYPRDHQRTRLTHALEVAQVATAIARAANLNVALTEAIALAHDCGHGPGGHASEDAFGRFLPDGYDHAIWGADVVLTKLNLCRETLDGIRHHSWSLPNPLTPEGEVVSWADRIAYCAHDLEDAVSTGMVAETDLPERVREVAGTTRSRQLGTFIGAVISCIAATGRVGMDPLSASALSALRQFNYERVYTRPAAQDQAQAVIAVLTALVDYYIDHPDEVPLPLGPPGDHQQSPVKMAVTYVGGMTDRYAFDTATEKLGWDPARLPRGVDLQISYQRTGPLGHDWTGLPRP